MSSLSEEDRANLVAFLDGELDEGTARALEARLNLDPSARAKAETLRKTWELLDYLPRPEPSTSFTNRTLEKLAVRHTTGPHLAIARGRLPRWIVALGWAAALVVAGASGLGAAHLLWSGEETPPPEAAEVEEILVRYPRVVENERLFEEIDNLDFLRSLGDPKLFGEDETGS